MQSNGFSQFIELFFSVGIGAILIAIGFFAGRFAERKHLASLEKRESALATMLVTDLKNFPAAMGEVAFAGNGVHAMLVTGEAVISSDYFKTFLSFFRKIIGGELGHYRLLLERARREASVRMLEQARSLGYDAVCNVRFEGYDIAAGIKAGNKKPIVSVAVQASGTGYRLKAA